MKNEKKRPLILRILAGALLVLAVILFINRYSLRQVWCNAFSPTLPLDESKEWNGGTSYEGLAYGEDSPAQYIDLYVPDTGSPMPLFVMIHGGGFAFNDASPARPSSCTGISVITALPVPASTTACLRRLLIRLLSAT